ncbi:hypothetical protein DYB36_001679 [Aphanomyces astaci]|uniref:Carboxypeptidase n=1 Tax=Aphanomyces astaci TaxID=112090 RepID=A0A397B2N1_APHAT|nr:hypothetical protein DYB36_001679 [Aphanomyces astaci]
MALLRAVDEWLVQTTAGLSWILVGDDVGEWVEGCARMELPCPAYFYTWHHHVKGDVETFLVSLANGSQVAPTSSVAVDVDVTLVHQQWAVLCPSQPPQTKLESVTSLDARNFLELLPAMKSPATRTQHELMKVVALKDWTMRHLLAGYLARGDITNGTTLDMTLAMLHDGELGCFEGTSTHTPVIVWLNGGPGASSMTGLLTEMGPYRINSDGSLSRHPHSWTALGHMLFFDQPVGTGYTSAKNESGYVNSQLEMAEQLHVALTAFFTLHPEYASNPVVVAGESYAGKYVPHIAHYIHDKNNQLDKSSVINLWGIAIGNGEMKPLLQTLSVPDYALALGLIDQEQFIQHRQSLDTCASLVQDGKLVEAFGVCQRTEDEVRSHLVSYSPRSLTKTLSTYFNLPETREALNIPPHTLWTSIDGSAYGDDPAAPSIARHLLNDEMVDVPDAILETLMNHYHVLFYAGNMDGSSCNHLGVSRVVDQLHWDGADEYHTASRRPWTVDSVGGVGGLAKQSGNVAVVVITNSGHLVPTDQPEASLDMMRRFLTQRSFHQG